MASLFRFILAFAAVAILFAPGPASYGEEARGFQVTVVPPIHGKIEVQVDESGKLLDGFDAARGGTVTLKNSFSIVATPDPGPYTFLSWAPPWNAFPNPLPLSFFLDRDTTVEAYFYDDPQFPDKVLETHIRAIVGNPGEPLTPQQLEKVTVLNVLSWEYNVGSVKGLELCTQLQRLALMGGGNDLSPLKELKRLTFLRWTVASGTDLAPLAGLKALEYLNLSGCKECDFTPISSLANLNTLFLHSSELENTDFLAGLAKLTFLSLRGNQLQALGKGIMENKGLQSGAQVWLDDNPLSDHALCEEIPALRARGVSVSYPATCQLVAGQSPTTNQGAGR